MRDSAVNLLKGLLERYSPSGEEDEVADFLTSEMTGLGFDVRKDDVGNVIGEYGKGSPRLLLCGHMDTVPPELPVYLNDGYIYGRGAVDAKGPLATLVMAASGLADEGFPGSFVVVGVVDEEGESTGVKKLLEDRLEADYAVFGEPTNVDTITVGYKGGLLLKIHSETETGHSSAPWLYENSIEKAIEIWNLIENYRLPEEDPESRFHSLSYCLRGIKSTGVGSVVPSSCEALIDVRIPPAISADSLKGEIFDIIEDYMKRTPQVKVKIKVLGQTEPYLANKRSPLVRALSRSIWNNRKVKVGLINKTGTGDMNIYGRATGTPCITYGPGNSQLDHTPFERIKIQDYLESINVLKKALIDLS